MAFRIYPTVDKETMTVEICNGSGKRAAVEELFYGYIELDYEMPETNMVFSTRDFKFNRTTKGKVARRGYIYKVDFLHPQTGELLTVVWSQVDNTYNGTTFQPLVEIRYDRQNRKSVVELSMPDNMSLMRLIDMPENIQQFVDGYNVVEYKPNLNDYVTAVSGTAAYVKIPNGEFLEVTDIPCKWYAVTKKETFLAEGVTAYTEAEWKAEITPSLPQGWCEGNFYHNQFNESDENQYPHIYLNGVEWKPEEGRIPVGVEVIPLPKYLVSQRRRPSYYIYPYYYNPETVKVVECLPYQYDEYHPKARWAKKDDNNVVYSSHSNNSDSPFAILAKYKKYE